MTRAGLGALRGGPGLGLVPLFVLLAIWALIASHLAPSDAAVAADFGPATVQEGGSVLYLPLVSCAGDACPDAVTVQGQVVWDTGDPVAGAQVVVRVENEATQANGVTGSDGRFQIQVSPLHPNPIVVEVTAQPPGLTAVHTARRSSTPVAAGPLDMGLLVLPDPRSAALQQVVPGVWQSPDNSLVAQNVPANVARMWARVYDPATFSQSFPGAFVDADGRALNSDVFLWIAAQDNNGQAVTTLSTPATVRAAIPRSQWPELEDEQPGNDGIQVPIYWYDEAQDTWIRKPDGVLTDGSGNQLAESDLPAIHDGTFSGTVYVTFQVDHFSWWNLDKPADCGPDFSDAPDPYPVARHDTACRAWLGPWADAENAPEKPDMDAYDDAVLGIDPLVIGVSNWDWPGLLYLNVLIDHNQDGDWSDAGEWVVQNQAVAVPQRQGTGVTTGASWNGQDWMRVTLTGAPIANYTGAGTFPIGETEDYKAAPTTQMSILPLGAGRVLGPQGEPCTYPGMAGCQLTAPIGSQVTLRQETEPGASFLGWYVWEGGPVLPEPASCSEGSATGDQCTVTVKPNAVVIARFSGAKVGVLAALVRVSSNPPGIDCQNGAPPGEACTESYPAGTELVLTADRRAFWAVGVMAWDLPGGFGWAACQESPDQMWHMGTTCTLALQTEGAVYTVAAFPAELRPPSGR